MSYNNRGRGRGRGGYEDRGFHGGYRGGYRGSHGGGHNSNYNHRQNQYKYSKHTNREQNFSEYHNNQESHLREERDWERGQSKKFEKREERFRVLTREDGQKQIDWKQDPSKERQRDVSKDSRDGYNPSIQYSSNNKYGGRQNINQKQIHPRPTNFREGKRHEDYDRRGGHNHHKRGSYKDEYYQRDFKYQKKQEGQRVGEQTSQTPSAKKALTITKDTSRDKDVEMKAAPKV